MKIKLFLTIFLITLTSECRNPRTRRVQQQPTTKIEQLPKPAPVPQKRYITVTPYSARLEGVECNLCAQAATKILSSFDGLDAVQIALVDEDAEYATVNFMWNKKPDTFDVLAINQALDKEGFEMTEVAAQKTVVTVVK